MKIPLVLLIAIFLCTACSVNGKVERHDNSKPDKQAERSRNEKSVLPGKTYYVLLDEYLMKEDKNNPDVKVLYRVYKKYDGMNDQVSDQIHSVALPKEIDDLLEAKEYLKAEHQEWLKLEPHTIVSDRVLDQWIKESYDTANIGKDLQEA